MTEELKPFKERRVAIAAFNGCLKAKCNEFCLPCVIQATVYDHNVTGDRRAAPYDYPRTPDTSAKGDVALPKWLLASAQALLDLDASNSLVPHGIGGHARGIIQEFIDAHKSALQAPRSDTSAVELVRELVRASMLVLIEMRPACRCFCR